MSDIVNESRDMIPKYLKILSKDAQLLPILDKELAYRPAKSDDLSLFLYSTIVKQQLSTRVGDVFYQRFTDIFGGRAPASAEVDALPIEALRAIGLSNSKAAYIKNVARFDIENGLDAAIFNNMTDEEVTNYITAIKGIGRWTAHLFLIAALGREDVFPADDLILQKAMAALYGLDRTNKKQFLEDIHRISENWSPYKTYASLYMWQWKPNPVL